MSFTPSPGLYAAGVWEAAASTDPVFSRRAGLIAFGLMATLAAAFEFGVHAFRRRSGWATVLTSYALAVACAVIGWRSFPYWVNGVFAFETGHVPYTDLDPKALMPSIWIGDFWRLGVFAIYPATVVAVAGSLVAAIAYSRERWFIHALIPIAAAAIATLFLLAYSPQYMAWLLD